MRPRRSVPPESAAAFWAPRSLTASSMLVGAAYSKAFIVLRLPFSGSRGQGVQDIAGCHRPLSHPYADRVAHRIADGGGGRDRGGLAHSDHAARFLVGGLIGPHDDFGDVGRSGQ